MPAHHPQFVPGRRTDYLFATAGMRALLLLLGSDARAASQAVRLPYTLRPRHRPRQECCTTSWQRNGSSSAKDAPTAIDIEVVFFAADVYLSNFSTSTPPTHFSTRSSTDSYEMSPTVAGTPFSFKPNLSSRSVTLYTTAHCLTVSIACPFPFPGATYSRHHCPVAREPCTTQTSGFRGTIRVKG